MKEEEIRPADIFDQYLNLAIWDANNLFSEKDWISVDCPACGSKNKSNFGIKHNFRYQSCDDCQTIYADPRPTAEGISEFYRKGKSTKFWATDFYKVTANSRREKIWKPKAERIVPLLRSGNFDWICDIGGGYGIFAEEISKIWPGRVIIIEPSPSLAETCRAKGFEVIQKGLEDVTKDNLPATTGFFTSFELVEHLQNTRHFFHHLRNIMNPRSRALITTLSGIGLDIQELGINSKSVFPPHHLNFFNPKSMEILANETGFEIESIETPGKLDVDILKKSQSTLGEGFIKSVLIRNDHEELSRLQNFLSRNKLSSHMEVVLQPQIDLQ